jgi:hypothetical protein
MQIIKITDNFYRLVDVFSDITLQKIHNCFQDKSSFSKLWQGEYYRLEAGQFDQTVSDTIKTELSPAQEFAENMLGEKLYSNNTQLWEDFDGYLNATHKDSSRNLTANIQVYVLPGDESMGTAIIENGIATSVPYKYNCGYMLIHPTEIEHGMTAPVKDRRMSIYQSYRNTVHSVSEW